MSDYGDLEFDRRWYDEPVEKYLEFKREEDKITEDRHSEITNVIKNSKNTTWDSWDNHIPEWQEEMSVDDARSFMRQVADAPGVKTNRTVNDKMDIVNTFLSELYEREVVESNPVAYVCDNTDFDDLGLEDGDEGWIERTIDEIGDFFQSIPNVKQRGIGMMFAKTGIRLGENYNIDLPFIHLDDEIYYKTLDIHNSSIHQEISDHPDSLYIPSEPTVGEKFRSEKRQGGNKRKRGTRIPVDKELKHALLDWLAVRPETEYPHPLWVSSNSNSRMGHDNPNRKLTNYWAEQTGFVDNGDTKKFTPHYFRHVFTTELKPGMGHHDGSLDPTLVKFLRGDIEDDIMQVYTHNWGSQVRQKYFDAIYKFGVYE